MVAQSQTINDGARNLVMHFTNDFSGGVAESDVVKVDVSALSAHPDGRACTEVVIKRIYGQTHSVDMALEWDASANVLFYTATSGESFDFDVKRGGGIYNNAGDGKTGDVLFSTSTPVTGSNYAVTLEMVKKYE